MSFQLLKLVHVVSGAVLFGTGLGIAWFLLTAHLSGDIRALRVTARNVIVADWLFTATAVVVQPVSGWLLMRAMGLDLSSSWFVMVAALYVLAGCCWLPVVVLQYRIARFARAAQSFAELPAGYRRAFRWWCALGVPAFTAVLALYALMVFKPGIS